MFISVEPINAEGSKKIYTCLWVREAWKDGLKIAKENGFDVAVMAPTKEALNEAREIGIKCIVYCGLTTKAVENDRKWQEYLEGLRGKILEFKDHPAVFAWYVGDEPDGHIISIEKIKIATALIKSLDKKRPLFAVLCAPGRWREYLRYFDIIAIDPYLIKNKDGTADTPDKVRRWIRKLKADLKSLNINKSVWVILGAFEMRPWIPFFFKSPYKKLTVDEFKEMVDIALSEKVDAISVWTLTFKNMRWYKDWYLPKDDPALWEEVKDIPKICKDMQNKH